MKQIPKGYKHTALGILPQDWEVVRLGEVMDFLKTYQNPRSDLNDYDDIHYVHYGEIHTKYQHFIDFNRAVLPKINQKNLKMPLSLLQNGDVIVVDASEDIIDIAKSVEIQNLDSVIAESLRGSATNEAIHKRKIQAVAGLHTFLLRDRGQYFANNYKGYILYNQDVRRNIQRLATGISVFAISKTNLSNILIPLPPIKEQEKIAQILNTWDSYIDNLEKLIEAKQRYKKGLMQRLLTPPQEDLTGGLPRSLTTSRNNIQALRFKEFSGTWQEVKLGEVFKITRGSVLPLSKISPCQNETFCYPVYSSQTKHNGLMGYYDKYMFENAITWTTDGVNAGNVKFRKGKFYCTNVCGVLLSDRGYANGCVAEILNLVTKKYVSYTGNPKLMNNVVSEIKIQMPTTLQEQEKIARVLSLCDEEIQTLKKMLESRKKQKRGLMQNLLSGKVRVKA